MLILLGVTRSMLVVYFIVGSVHYDHETMELFHSGAQLWQHCLIPCFAPWKPLCKYALRWGGR